MPDTGIPFSVTATLEIAWPLAGFSLYSRSSGFDAP
jgi:hypothetical protein